ncbi:MAG: methyltransferase [Candidatus Schmidhempelia sp.]|nr:methyltransferase [Candidatus Schmidhempelia sp.]
MNKSLKKNGFTFKQFFVAHDKSPMKITTDSVLLGAWAAIKPTPNRILDIGTGCGVIALMLAQRLKYADSQIDAIDINQDAITQCQQNNDISPFKSINIIYDDVNHYALQHSHCYDLIISNPPYFATAVECRNIARQHARYTSTLNHVQLLNHAKQMLISNGRCCLVLPWHILSAFTAQAKQMGWFIERILHVKYNPQYSYTLALISLILQPCQLIESELCMRNSDKSYTQEFKTLLQDFYLRF